MKSPTKSDDRCYSDLILLPTFEERYEYLKLDGEVGAETFGFDRYLNQSFYRSHEWRSLRDFIIIRDNGCDLGIDGRTIYGRIYIHHMNPIGIDDIKFQSDLLLNPEYLVAVSFETHNAIHYGDANQLISNPIERKPFDTCPWRQKEVNHG